MLFMKNLFEEFFVVDKAIWVVKVEKDLKGKLLEDLFWYLGEDIIVVLFYYLEDIDY